MTLEEKIDIGGKDISLEMDDYKFHIFSDDELTLHEYSYVLCVALTYVNSEIYKRGLTMDEAVKMGHKMYKRYHNIAKGTNGRFQ